MYPYSTVHATKKKNHKYYEGGYRQHVSTMTTETTNTLANLLDFGSFHLCPVRPVKPVRKSAFLRVGESRTRQELRAPTSSYGLSPHGLPNERRLKQRPHLAQQPRHLRLSNGRSRGFGLGPDCPCGRTAKSGVDRKDRAIFFPHGPH